MVIVFFTLIPFIPIKDLNILLLNFIENIAPNATHSIIRKSLVDIIEQPRGGLLSLNFILAIVFATNGFASIIEAFNNTYHTIESRTWIKQKLVSTLLFFICSIIIRSSISLLTTGSVFLKFLISKHILKNWTEFYFLEIIKWIILVAMFFFTISFIYYLAPEKQSKFRFISAGSSLATLLAIAASVGFNFYVQNFSSYNALYGSIGTLLIILIWIYFNSIILLIGFELNASIQQAGLGRKQLSGKFVN
jgi:membrane protein